jgi:hypothetical protein
LEKKTTLKKNALIQSDILGHQVAILESNMRNYLVGVSTPLKNMKVSWYDYSQYVEK